MSQEPRRPTSTVSAIPTYDDVAAIAEALPGVVVGARHGNRTWFVGRAAFAWERPFSKADLRRFGTDAAPSGRILAVRVDDLAEKEAVLAAGTRGLFTIPHFDGYAAVLVQLDVVGRRVLRRTLEDGWAAVAPAALLHDSLKNRQHPRKAPDPDC
jgi:hypothetical protein